MTKLCACACVREGWGVFMNRDANYTASKMRESVLSVSAENGRKARDARQQTRRTFFFFSLRKVAGALPRTEKRQKERSRKTRRQNKNCGANKRASAERVRFAEQIIHPPAPIGETTKREAEHPCPGEKESTR